MKTQATKDQYETQRKRYFAYGEPPSISEPKDLTKHIIGYLLSMKHLSYSYRNLALAAIKHHYDHLPNDEDVYLNWSKIADYLGSSDDVNELRAYTKEEIKKLLDVADLKYRSVILLLSSSGMRREAMTQIKIADMEYLEEYKLYKIKIYRRSKSHQIAFTSPEAATAIDLYKSVENVYLFPSRQLKDDINKRNGGHIRPSAITIQLLELEHKAGLQVVNDSTSSRNSVPAIHGLRHFCINTLANEKANIPTEIQKILVGHTIGKARGAYVKPSEERLLSEYLKALPFLQIDPSLVLQAENTELKKAKSEIESLKEQVTKLTAAAKEWTEFMKGIEEGKTKIEAESKAWREEMAALKQKAKGDK